MFDLEKSLAVWRRSIEHNGAFLAEDREELEQHVRDQTAGLVRRGLSEEEAFSRAMREMGDYGSTEREYGKVYWQKLKRRGKLSHELYWRMIMLHYYARIAYRNLLRHKGYTFINVFGLAVGLAVCLLIALYVRHEFSYDRYHEKANRIYRLVHAYQFGEDRASLPAPAPGDFQVLGNAPVGPALKADFPEVLEVVQFSGPREALFHAGERPFRQESIFYADSTVFKVFTWPLIAGDPGTALVAPFTAVLTESTARKYFGEENPVGRSLFVNNEHTYTVTGVVKDLPSNSHFTFEVLLSMESARQLGLGLFDDWGYTDFYTYFLVPERFSIERLTAKLPAFAKRHVPEEGYSLAVEPLTRVYLHSAAVRRPAAPGNLSNLYVFSTVALFILLIACVNFVNLSTARSVDRAKEVGVRKVVGAQRRALIGQFLGESVLLSTAACALSVLLAAVAMPLFREVTGTRLTYGLMFTPGTWLVLPAVPILVGLLAGVYPAVVLSRFQPAGILRGAFRTSAHGILLRKSLVVFQFGISVALLAGALVVFLQLNYLRDRELGFKQEHMLVINFGYDEAVQLQIEAIKEAFLRHPAVASATASRNVFGGFPPQIHTLIEDAAGQMQEASPNVYQVDYDYLEHFGIKMAAGRPFSRGFPSDTSEALILNETAAKLYGYTRPEDVIGKRFSQWCPGWKCREGTVIGVVRDFNYRSLRNRIEPLTIRMEQRWDLGNLTLNVKSRDLPGTIRDLERLWNQLAPHRPFIFNFLDESLDRQYRGEERFWKVFTTFTTLAILIACLGLLGLISFSVHQRAKEIGVRKVLGASVGSIVGLLSKDFLILVCIAFILAVPAAYFYMQSWLEDFEYHITLGPGVFLLAGVAALLIALATVSYQAVRAALADPVRSLRYE